MIPESIKKEYRTRLEIVTDVLRVVENSEKGSKKTHIMYGANLSYKLLLRYLKEVIRSNLIKKDGSSYFLTEKGVLFLKSCEEYQKRALRIEESINHLMKGKENLMKMLEER